jgi:hypothetical protein
MSSYYSTSSADFIKTPMDMPYNVPMNLQTTPPVVAPQNPPLPLKSVFGPLDKKYCIWFWFLSVIGFVLLVIVLVSGLFIGIRKGKGLEYYLAVIFGSLVYAVFYFQNRLLYTMCSTAL